VPVYLDSGPKTVRLRKITADEARDMLSRGYGYTSAIDHEGTAAVLTRILGMPVHANKIAVKMGTFDRAIHFILKTPLPEDAVQSVTESVTELYKLDFDLIFSEVD
jgi:hypothetical protein